MKVERELVVAAEPAAVYDLVMDAGRLGEWVSIHQGVKEQRPAGELRKGSTLTQSLKIAGKAFDIEWRVTRAERPSHVEWKGRGPVRSLAHVEYHFEPHGEGGTHFRYLNEYDLPGGPFGRAFGRAIAGASSREADRSLERLGKLFE